MSKGLARWVAGAFLVWTGFAQALGLGEIESRSRLNQLVSAQIPIVSASTAELDSLSVSLAANEEFDRAGIERGEFLSTLRFIVENQTIRVTSKQIAREPFVTFLLEVRWSGGRMLREYTLLLDPPNLASGTGISRPQATPIGESVAPDMPEAMPEAPPAETAAAAPMTEPGAQAPAAEMPAGEAPAETASAPPPDQPPPPAATAEGGMYGPVAPQETLWSIAYKLRPDPATITMDQMQVAIFNANPKAFHGGSIRGLMKGSMLRIPGGDEARGVDAASAKALVAQAREGGAPAAPSRPVEEATAPAPAPMETPVEAAPPPQPEPEPATAASSPPPPTSEAALPSEAAPSGAPPPSETAPAPAPEVAVPPPAPVETKPEPQPAAKPAPKPARAAESPSIVETLIDSAKGAFENPLVQYAAAGVVALLVVGFVLKLLLNKLAQMRYNRASKQVEAARTAPAATVGSEDVTQVAEQPEAAPSMQAALDDADTPTVVSQPQLASTVAMGSETMQQTMQQTQVQEPPQAATGGRGVDFDVTSNFASETVQINLDAGDPLSEAEFHRAYGLYDEAALMLKQALQKDPNRTDARVKLAEIYFEAGKAGEFVETAKELKAQLPADKWQPIAIMGSQIAPTNELFAGATGGAGGAVDLAFDEPAAAAAPAAAPAPAAPAAAPAAAAPAGDALEFDLGSLTLDTGAAEAPAAAPATAAAPAGDALEFDLGAIAAPEAPAVPAAEPAAAPAAGGELNLDLGDFDINAGAAAAAAAPAGGGEVVELSTEPLAEPVASAGDEAGTKLDLARAYLDMGDADMAKSLLNEVASQGNDAQKKEAEELLKRASA